MKQKQNKTQTLTRRTERIDERGKEAHWRLYLNSASVLPKIPDSFKETVAKLLLIFWYEMHCLGSSYVAMESQWFLCKLVKYVQHFRRLICILLMTFGFMLSLLGLLAWGTCSKFLPGKLKTIHIFSWILKVSSKN